MNRDVYAPFFMEQLKPCNKKRPAPDKQFFIYVPVKPYVKRFLHLNYGDPVYFHPDIEDYTILRECLANSRKSDKKLTEFISPYKETVTVLLSERDFYRYGWDMNKKNIIKFGIHFEIKVKALMRSVIGIYHGLGMPINMSINKFMDRFYFDDNVWPYDSICKDFRRNGFVEIIDFDNEVFSKVEKIVLTNLSKKRTITQSFIKDYENDQQAR